MTNSFCISDSFLELSDHFQRFVCTLLRMRLYDIHFDVAIEEKSYPWRKEAQYLCSPERRFLLMGTECVKPCWKVSVGKIDEQWWRGRKYHVRRRQVRSFGGHEVRINERISGGKEVNCGKDMIDFGFLSRSSGWFRIMRDCSNASWILKVSSNSIFEDIDTI